MIGGHHTAFTGVYLLIYIHTLLLAVVYTVVSLMHSGHCVVNNDRSYSNCEESRLDHTLLRAVTVIFHTLPSFVERGLAYLRD